MIIDQVPTKLIPDVIKNTNYKICHRMTSIDDCAVIAQAIGYSGSWWYNCIYNISLKTEGKE